MSKRNLLLSLMAVLAAIFIATVPVRAEEQTYSYSVSLEDFDLATIPSGTITVGDSGQIRPAANSVLSPLQYAFQYEVSDPSVLSIDAKGNWLALKTGTVTITVNGWRDYNQSPEFEAELDQYGIKRLSTEYRTTEIPFSISNTVTVTEKQSKISVYRLYNPLLKTHLYTTDSNENTVLAGRGWQQEGIAWKSSLTGDSPVYRLYHHGLKVHLYTKDANEYSVLAQRGWRQEGVSFQSQGSTPVYRLYHAGLRKHLYTRDENEKNILSAGAWRYEGIAWYSE